MRTLVHDVIRHCNMNCVRSKDAHKQLARPSLYYVSIPLVFCFQCRAGLVSGPDVLKVVEAFRSETNFTVWNDLITNMGGIGLILQYSDCYPSFKAFCIELYEPIGNKLGWDAAEGEGRSNQRALKANSSIRNNVRLILVVHDVL